MKKQILNLGTILDKATQKLINGGDNPVGFCDENNSCPSGQYCNGFYCYVDNDNGAGGSNNCTHPWQFCPNGGISCTGC
ncbi:hypothetical protein P8625_06820 [Tenacibaculum tangerinum]|uniref:Chitin-binding type-1 domain-containing protein n=1 Tax=Tenacibaculum tangerinum TaxID=3038772 RepID=A0ABY8L912_9FLAO|nr:hypothetical protein [Tenacibaculum tangerinum]WGH76848.1 hypothetical protein P8625_06820 [Tenacibaculum tangerinum]